MILMCWLTMLPCLKRKGKRNLEVMSQSKTNTVPIQFNILVDAFVALGGKADKGGYVNKNVLM